MNLLVLDTATDRCATACSVDGVIFENTRSIPRLHNKYLLEMLDELFLEAGINPRALTAIGFTAGPGSFTGIRISAAVCQALAVSAGALVVPLPSSLLLAHAARRVALEANSSFVGVQTVLRSRAKFAYLAAYRASTAKDVANVFECVADDELFDDDHVRATPLPDGWVRVIDSTPEEATALNAKCVELAVTDLLHATTRALEHGEGLPPEGAQPRYVQGDTPWKPR